MGTKDFKKTKGITLISLVVSIVVLLILAGVSIVTLTGENRNINSSAKCKYHNENSRNRGTSKFNLYSWINRKIIRANKHRARFSCSMYTATG